jgi:DNA-binding transcriptional LysR family regulator
MDLRELEAVVAVHELGSFSAAASALFISQPALTRRVALLERELDLKLFVRSPRGVFLTDAGRALIEPAQRALQEADRIKRTLDLMHGGTRGTLLITGVPNLNIGYIGSLIGKFHEKLPDVDVQVSYSVSTAAAVESVEAGVNHLAIVDLPVESESVTVADIWEDDYLAVFASDPTSKKTDGAIPIATAEMLTGRPMVHLPEILYPRQEPRMLFDMLGMEPTSRVETEHCELLIPIALGGRGVTVVPRFLAMYAREQGASIAQPPRPITRRIGLARRRTETSPTIGQLLRLARTQRNHIEPSFGIAAATAFASVFEEDQSYAQL